MKDESKFTATMAGLLLGGIVLGPLGLVGAALGGLTGFGFSSLFGRSRDTDDDSTGNNDKTDTDRFSHKLPSLPEIDIPQLPTPRQTRSSLEVYLQHLTERYEHLTPTPTNCEQEDEYHIPAPEPTITPRPNRVRYIPPVAAQPRRNNQTNYRQGHRRIRVDEYGQVFE